LYGYLDGSIEAPEKEMTIKDKDGVEVIMQDGLRKISLS
jgi:hypothetical protein